MRLLFDENFNHRILRGLRLEVPDIDFVTVQDCGLRGQADPKVLSWAAENSRILVTHDLNTIPRFAYRRITDGDLLAGLILVPDSLPIGQAIDELAIILRCSSNEELKNQILFLPL